MNAVLRQRLAEHKQALLDHLRQTQKVCATEAETIHPTPADRPCPLSSAQERLWFVQQVEPRSAVFNLSRAWRISGALDATALEASLNAVVCRQQALRSNFVADARGAAQCVTPFRRSRLRIIDLSRLSIEQRERECRQRVRALARRPFNLTDGRLLRVTLLRLSGTEHLLALCTHHIVADAWSMGLLRREIWTNYHAITSGNAAPFCDLPVQYRDYAVWQRRWLETAPLDGLFDYWRKQLESAPSLALPTDRPRPKQLSYQGKRQRVEVSEPLTRALKDLSRRENATLFMTLLAVFQLLLNRYTGQENILVGTPVANRGRPELESIVGLFINTIVLRADFAGEPTFSEVLRRVKTTCLEGYARQHLPLEKLIETLNPAREPNRHPLVQVFFVLQNTPRWEIEPRGLRVRSFEVDNQTAQFDLSLYLRERGGKLLGYLEYATDLFEQPTMERMVGHFVALIENIVAEPTRPVAMLEMLGAAERQRLLIDWNHTAAKFPSKRTINELFEAQVARTPDKVALESAGELLSYRDLNSRANRLAHYLQRWGVGVDQRVGILVERSADMVVGLLAILKAGAAYVPLDPSYPKERLRFMLDDACASLLLTTAKLVEDRDHQSLLIDSRFKVVYLDRDEAAIASESDHNPESGTTSEDAAYVIYTSGSTGVPKGVFALHRGAVNRFVWMWRQYPFAAYEICCAKTSISFVDSVWEIFGPLLQGVPLVIVPDEIGREPRRLIRFLGDKRVTRIVLVPSLLQAFLAEEPSLQKALPVLRTWTSSGEVLPIELARRFNKSHPRARLLNIYGSAEVGADVTCFEYRSGKTISLDRPLSEAKSADGSLRPASARVPIGRPIDNTQVYVLDRNRQPVPVGIPGELFVGGAGLARGYWQQPDLTAEKFIANPFTTDTDARLFRTGDQARYLPDGNLEYLGRLDQQVQIRGQRVELGEVEATLSRHPGVKQCAVVLDNVKLKIENGKFPERLVAYVARGGSAGDPKSAELRAFLAAKLPPYMVPAEFVLLDRLPLSPNGKIDRKSLSETSRPVVPSAMARRRPRTKTQKAIGAIWRELLDSKECSIDADFFESGGHSLLAATLVARVSSVLGREITLRDFLIKPTIATLAAKVADAALTKNVDALAPITTMKLTGELPLSLAQEQFLKLDELLSGASFLHLPYGYRLSGQLDLAALRQSLQSIVDRHAVLRTVFKQSARGYVQVIRHRRKAFCPLRDLSALPAAQQDARLNRLSKEDAERPFNLEHGAPFRFTLVRLGETRHVLFVTLHHIIADQSSLRLFRNELAEVYRATVERRPSRLNDLPFQFVDFTRWQAAQMKAGCFAEQINYWTKRLGDAPRKLIFYGGKKRPKRLSTRIACRMLTLDEALFAKVRNLARQRKSTTFVILLAAIDAWLYRWTGCCDLRVGTLVANRSRRGSETLIGYFVNAVVLKARLQSQMSFAELIEHAREATIAGFARQNLPIEVLAQTLRKRHRRKRRALYQVLLNYRRFDFNKQTVAGLTIASYSENTRVERPEFELSSADISFDFREASTKLTLSVNFKVDLFDEAALEATVASFAVLLEQAVEWPERRLTDFDLPPAKSIAKSAKIT